MTPYQDSRRQEQGSRRPDQGSRRQRWGSGRQDQSPRRQESAYRRQDQALRRQETAYRRQDRREYGASQELAPPSRQPDTFYWPTNNRYQGLGNF